MPFCTECGTQVADSAKFCQQCGNPLGGSQAVDPPTPVSSEADSPTPVSPEVDPPTPDSSEPVSSETDTSLGDSQAAASPTLVDSESVSSETNTSVKSNSIGCDPYLLLSGFFGLFTIIFIIGVIIYSSRDESPNQSATTRSTRAVTRLTSTPTSTRTPTATATPIPTATPVPTATPTRPPIVMQLDALLNEYTENKVRANSRLRYQENGKIPVTISGYVSEVEELHVDIRPSQLNRELSYRGVNCYYSNVEAALHLTKGQLTTITGKISGEDDYSTRIAIFDCEIKGFSFPTLPIVPAQVVRKNTVQVFCTAQSLFGTTGYKGTGVIIDPRAGLILTVHHVIDNDCERIAVKIPGHAERVPASIDKHCASIDRAQLRIPPQVLTGLRLQPILRAAAPAQKDQEVYFWGFGTGELRLETGVVTSVSRNSTSTDAHAIPGDSGSPVYNEYGHLLGTMSRSNASDRSVYTGNQC